MSKIDSEPPEVPSAEIEVPSAETVRAIRTALYGLFQEIASDSNTEARNDSGQPSSVIM